VEAEILPTVRELGIGFVAYSPLGRGFLTGKIEKPEDLAEDDSRRERFPRFERENFEANLKLTDPRPQFTFHDQTCPIYTHPRFLAGSTLQGCRVDQALIAEGCWLDQCQIDRTVVGIRSVVRAGARISQSVLLGADYYAEATAESGVALGIGRDVVLDRVIVDKNARIGDGARLVNSAGVKEKDGDGYFIREGIIIVPKGATIAPGTDI